MLQKQRLGPRYDASTGFHINIIVRLLQVLSCTNVGNCEVYECNVPAGVDKNERSTLEVEFSLDKSKAEDSETEDKYKVITSICTMAYNR